MTSAHTDAKGTEISLVKASFNTSYIRGGTVFFIISVINSGSAPFTGVVITDDLGGYESGTDTLCPLSYVEVSAVLYVDGVSQPINVDATEAQLVFSGFTIPTGGNAMISYRTTVNSFAPLTSGSEIENTATLTATGLTNPVTASARVPVTSAPVLSITKGVSPDSIPENGQLTYTLTVINTGALAATEGITVTDTFDPILSDITVTYNGIPWTEGVNYTYDEATGVFTTLDGQITVPDATYTQDPTTGLWSVDPGAAVIRITGTV